VKRAGWDGMMQIREEVNFTKGRIIVRGKLVTRGKAKRADYILYYKPNIPIAIIEAKDKPQRRLRNAAGARLGRHPQYSVCVLFQR
jgi:type I restriction enzyme R subunit